MIDMPLIALTLGNITLAILILVYQSLKSNNIRNWWAPPPFFAYSLLISAPGFLAQALNPVDLYEIIESIAPSMPAEQITTQTTATIFLSYFFVLLGHRSKLLKILFKRSFYFRQSFRMTGLPQNAAIIFLLLGCATWIYILHKHIGDLLTLWQNLSMRTELTSGIGYLQAIKTISLYFFIVYSTMSYVFKIGFFRYKLIYFTLLIFSILILVSFGGRSPALTAVLTAIITYSFIAKTISPFNIKIIFIASLLLASALLLGLPRLSDVSPQDFYENPSHVAKKSVEVFNERIIVRMGSISRQATIVSYFKNNDAWLGVSYLDLITAPIPRGMFENKPPVDDGIYVFNMSKGYAVKPNLPLGEYMYNSWPPGNWVGYMNWLVPGLLFLSYISGALSAFLFNLARLTKKPYWIYLYARSGLWGTVSLSVYGIVTILASAVIGGLLLLVVLVFMKIFFTRQSALKYS